VSIAFLKILALFRLIRVGNLLLLSGTLFLVRYTLVNPILELYGTTSALNEMDYLLLSLSVVITAASGYVINNIIDKETDDVNQKDNGIDIIGVRASKILYAFLFVGAIVCSYVAGGARLNSTIFLVTASSCGLLYFYSSDYKNMPFLGNLIVALLTSMTIGLPLLADSSALANEPVKTFLIAYACFAFLTTWLREIIKDCEDLKGDLTFGSKTLPILFGLRFASLFAGFLGLIICSSIGIIQYATKQWEDLVSFTYVSALIQLPLLIVSIKLLLPGSDKPFARLSLWMKLVMVAGLLSMAIFYLTSIGIISL
jgi:4-hydroxybenzoate polyprenyltransferase